jgi:hypothetical protein
MILRYCHKTFDHEFVIVLPPPNKKQPIRTLPNKYFIQMSQYLSMSAEIVLKMYMTIRP